MSEQEGSSHLITAFSNLKNILTRASLMRTRVPEKVASLSCHTTGSDVKTSMTSFVRLGGQNAQVGLFLLSRKCFVSLLGSNGVINPLMVISLRSSLRTAIVYPIMVRFLTSSRTNLHFANSPHSGWFELGSLSVAAITVVPHNKNIMPVNISSCLKRVMGRTLPQTPE